jgi:hypothetical protein
MPVAAAGDADTVFVFDLAVKTKIMVDKSSVQDYLHFVVKLTVVVNCVFKGFSIFVAFIIK